MKLKDEDGKGKPSKREPFCWIEKPKLRMIGDVFSENSGSVKSARSVYLALAEIASDKQRDTFDANQQEIATRAGLSVPSVKRLLPVFRQLGLIKIKRNSINGFETRSTYTLVRGYAVAHGEPALAQHLKTKRATEEEFSEETFERTARKEKSVSSSTCGSSLADEQHEHARVHGEHTPVQQPTHLKSLEEEAANTIARSTPRATEANIVITPSGEAFNVTTAEYEW